jgi:hypothetical protein
MAEVKISGLPVYTGDTSGSHLVMNDAANTATYTVTKETLFSNNATTGSNTFIGNQTISGSINFISQSGIIEVTSGSYSINNVPIDGGIELALELGGPYGLAILKTDLPYTYQINIGDSVVDPNNPTVGKAIVTNNIVTFPGNADYWALPIGNVDPVIFTYESYTINISGPDIKKWQFNTSGGINLPNNTTLMAGFPNYDFIPNVTTLAGDQIYISTRTGSNNVGVDDNGAYVNIGNENWWFGTNGVLNIPSGIGDIKRDGVSVLGGGNISTGSFATTGSNQFIGTQNITGSLIVSSTIVNDSILALTGSDLIIDSGSLIITGSIILDGGALIAPSYFQQNGSIDVVAGVGGYAELTSNNLQSFVWVDNYGTYLQTSASHTWTFDNNGNSTFPGNIIGASNLATTGSNTFYGTQTVTGSVYISGNLIVQGTSSLQNITASAVSIGTNKIILNTDNPGIRWGGISVYDSGSSATTGSLLWDSQNNVWIYENPDGASYTSARLISGPKNSGSLGSEGGITVGKIVKAVGDDHIGDSIMNESGSSIYITGSVIADSFTGSFKGNINGSSTYSTLVSSQNSNTNQDYTFLFAVTGSNGYLQTYTDATPGVLYNPSTNQLKATGSLFGTASLATTASFALTASYALNAPTASATASYALTASYVVNAISSSYAATASYFSGSISNATTASYALTASNAPLYLPLAGGNLTGTLFGSGKTIQFQDLVLGYGTTFGTIKTDGTKYISFYPTNAVESTRFLANGNIIIGTTFTDYGYRLDVSGSGRFTGGLTVTGSLVMSGSITGSLLGTASYATTASYALNASATVDTGSLTTTSSFYTYTSSLNNFSASILTYTSSLNAKTSSFATTGSNTFSGSQVISGSLTVTSLALISSSLSIPSGSVVTLYSGSNLIISDTGTLTVTGSSYLGNTAITGSLTVSGSNTLIGTKVITGSVYISGSKNIIGSVTITGSFIQSGSLVSYGPNTFTGSINQNGLYSNTGTYGNISVGAGQNASMVVVSGSGTVGGTNYIDFLRVINTAAGALNTNTTFRKNISGSIEIVNSAYNNTIVTIDDSGSFNIQGSVTMPNRHGFRVVGAGNSISSTTVITGSNYTADWSQGTGWNQSTGVFTAPIAGLYQVNVVCRTQSNSNSGINQIIVRKTTAIGNTTTTQIMVEWGPNTSANHIGGSTISKLAVGDTLALYVTAGTISFDGNDNFSVAYIG